MKILGCWKFVDIGALQVKTMLEVAIAVDLLLINMAYHMGFQLGNHVRTEVV